jgi:hypothetical protein
MTRTHRYRRETMENNRFAQLAYSTALMDSNKIQAAAIYCKDKGITENMHTQKGIDPTMTLEKKAEWIMGQYINLWNVKKQNEGNPSDTVAMVYLMTLNAAINIGKDILKEAGVL